MAGDASWSIEQLLEHADWIRKLAHILVRDPAAAEDLAQDTWVQALKSPPRQQGPLKPWLATILRNLVRERFRKNERRERRELIADGPRALEPADDLAQRAEAQKLVVEFVLELPAHYRDVVLLAYFEGLSGPEIAERMGIPEVTVRSRLKRGLDQLRERFDRKYGDRTAWVVMLMPLAKRPHGGAALVEGRAGETPASPTGIGASLPGLGGLRWAAGIAVAVVVAVVVGVVGVVILNRSTDRPVGDLPIEQSAAVRSDEPAPAPEIAPPTRATQDAEPPPAPKNSYPIDQYGVVVRDPDGRAVAGATVEAVWYVTRPESRILVQNSECIERSLGRVLTDESGAASIRCARGLTFDVAIKAAGYPEERLRDRLTAMHETITLRHGASIVGTVVDATTDRAIPDAYIEISRAFVSDTRALGLVRSDAVGAYRIDGLPDVPLLVLVVAEGFEAHGEIARLVPGRAATIDVKLQPAPRIHGRVTDATTGSPIVGAELGAFGKLITTHTDEQGRFTMTHFAQSKLEFGYLWIDADGYGYRTLFPELGVGAASDVNFELALEPAYAIQGTAVDERGKPIAGLRVHVRSEQPEPEHTTSRFPEGFPKADMRQAVSDERGRFTITNLRADTRHLLLADEPRYAYQSTLVPSAEQPGETRDVGAVTFVDSRAVYGRIMDADGRALAGMDVFAIPHSPLLRQLAPDEPLKGLRFVDVQSSRSDADGWFCFVTLGYGDVLLRVFDPNYGLIDEFVATMDPGNVTAKFEVKLDLRPDISGFMRTERGEPVGTGVVNVRRQGAAPGEDVDVFARPDGSFRVYHLKSGKYDLTARVRNEEQGDKPLHADDALTVEPGNQDVNIVLRPVQIVELSITTPDGRPYIGAECCFVTVAEPKRSFRRSVVSVDRSVVYLPVATEFDVEIRIPPQATGTEPRIEHSRFKTTASTERTVFEHRVGE